MLYPITFLVGMIFGCILTFICIYLISMADNNNDN